MISFAIFKNVFGVNVLPVTYRFNKTGAGKTPNSNAKAYTPAKKELFGAAKVNGFDDINKT